MIESFSDFNKRTSKNILESVENNIDLMDGVVLDSIDQKKLETEGEPKVKMVYDDKILSKMTLLVLNNLRKKINDKFSVSPYTFEIDGKDCSLISSESGTKFFAIYKEGINKVITYFTKNPVDFNELKSEFSVSTNKFGITKAVSTLISILTVENSDGSLNEEVTSPTPYKAVAWPKIYKSLYDDSGSLDRVNQALMKEFIELYDKDSDIDISRKLQDLEDDSEYLKVMRDIIGYKHDGTIDNVSAMRFVVFIHHVICANSGDSPATIASKLPNLWFWGAGASGNIAVDIVKGKGYVVKEAKAIIDTKVDDLQSKMDSVYDASEAICKYIKSGGRDNIAMRREMGIHRGLLITGVAGIGKSYSLDKAIDDIGLIEGVHLKRMGNATTSAREVYKELYENNNMLLIYDDTPEMFNTEAKISLWKAAMEADEKKRSIVSPDGEVRGKSDVYYGAQKAGVTRQESYFREVGKFTPYEKEKWVKKKESEIRDYYKRKRKYSRTSDWDDVEISDDVIKASALKEFEKFEENNAQVLIPDKFIFNGVIVYISNQTLTTFMKTAKDHWDALSRRMEPIDISPTRKVVWYWLRRKIVNDMNDDSIPNDLKLLPTESSIPGYNIEEVLTMIDEIIDGKYNTEIEVYGKMNWGVIKNIREYLFYGQKRWKEKILENMKINAERDK